MQEKDLEALFQSIYPNAADDDPITEFYGCLVSALTGLKKDLEQKTGVSEDLIIGDMDKDII